jgi:hypothetical protein
MLPPSRACGSAWQGLGRCLLTLKAPLRETVGGWYESGNGTGREEGEIASKTPPHGNVEADIHVGKPPLINQAWHKLGFVHRRDNGHRMRNESKHPRHLLGGSIWRGQHG